MATVTTSGPEISLKERERRYKAVRDALREKSIGCALVTGANLFYLTHGLPGARFGIFPTNDEPIMVRPGMSGAQAVQEGIKAMWEAGGDTESTLGMGFGKVPKQTPIIAHLSTDRVIEPGDIGTLTSHSCYHGYCGHSDQEIVFGSEP